MQEARMPPVAPAAARSSRGAEGAHRGAAPRRSLPSVRASPTLFRQVTAALPPSLPSRPFSPATEPHSRRPPRRDPAAPAAPGASAGAASGAERGGHGRGSPPTATGLRGRRGGGLRGGRGGLGAARSVVRGAERQRCQNGAGSCQGSFMRAWLPSARAAGTAPLAAAFPPPPPASLRLRQGGYEGG